MVDPMIQYSVIIPHYESLDVLHRAVSSVPDRQDTEVLIIDNSKTPIDATLFAERPNVHILYSPYGKGAGTARNVGLAQAKGKWLLMLDADDYFTQNSFGILDSYRNADEDIIFFEATSNHSESGNPTDRHHEFNELIYRYFDTKDDAILRYEWTSPWGKMIRSSLIQDHAIRFDETRAANDVMFSLLTGYYATSIRAVQEVIYCVTTREGSLTMTPSLKNLTDRIEVSIRYNKFVKAHGLTQFRKSIMYYILTTYRQYGLITALRLLMHSITLGNNPFIGATRWIKTYKSAQV